MKLSLEMNLTPNPEDIGNRFLWIVFGDRSGLGIFLGAIAFFMLTWRIGFFSTDSYTIANTMVAVVNGQLSITRIVFGPESGITPGMHVVDGSLYGRNYGMAFLALPIVLILHSVQLVSDVGAVLIAIWSLLHLALLSVVSNQMGFSRSARRIGLAVILGIFTLNLMFYRPIEVRWIPLIALQLATVVAAAFTGVFMYRLMAEMYTQRLGVVAGITLVIASPIGFWASFPKRHSFTALATLIILYSFFRSRETDCWKWKTRFRVVAYTAVGVFAWIHAAEALVLLVGLVVVDLVSISEFRVRDWVVIASAFLISIVPFVLTNILIAGHPFQPPRLLPTYSGETDVVSVGSEVPSDQSVSPQDGGDGTRGSGDFGLKSPFVAIIHLAVSIFFGLLSSVNTAFEQFIVLISYFERSVDDWMEIHDLYHIFIRSEYIGGINPSRDWAINLSMLESMPLLGGLIAAPTILYRSLNRKPRNLFRVGSANSATQVLVIGYILLFTTLYLDRLPVHHMLTVRYLHPIYPLGLVLLFQIEPVREALDSYWPRIRKTYFVTLVVGTTVYIGILWNLQTVLSESVQLYGLIALITGLFVGISTASTLMSGKYLRITAVALGGAAGIVTIYLIVSGLGFFAYTNEFALPLSRVIAEQLQPINPYQSMW